jgi:hypothetical protein
LVLDHQWQVLNVGYPEIAAILSGRQTAGSFNSLTPVGFRRYTPAHNMTISPANKKAAAARI